MKNTITMKRILSALAFLGFLSVGLMLSGCDNPIGGPDDPAAELSFTATIDEGATKTLLGEEVNSRRALTWAENDQMIVGGALYTVGDISTNGRSAVLVGSGAVKEGLVYKAYYPASLWNDGTPTLPEVQTYGGTVGTKVVASHLPMYAESTNTRLTFKNLCAVLSIRATGVGTVKEVRVTSSDRNLWGPFTVNAYVTYTHRWAVLSPSGNKRTVKLNCSNAPGGGVPLSQTEEVEFLIAIPKSTYPSGSLTVSFIGLDDNPLSDAISTKVALAAEAGTIYQVSQEVRPASTDFLFSVSATKKVYFSQGNLQYEWGAGDAAIAATVAAGNQPTTDVTGKWYFAEPEWQSIGTENYNAHEAMKAGTATVGVTRTDMLRWGTSGKNYGSKWYFPWSPYFIGATTTIVPSEEFGPQTTTEPGEVSLSGDAEWGTNTIENGAIKNGSEVAKNGWRTLEQRPYQTSEYTYVVNLRENAAALRGVGRIVEDDGTTVITRGLILLPDDWLSKNLDPKVNLASGSNGSFVNASDNRGGAGGANNIYTRAGWAKMQENGAVFLPVTGRMMDNRYDMFPYSGNYHGRSAMRTQEPSLSLTFYDFYVSTETVSLDYFNIGSGPYSGGGAHSAYAVRLVRDSDYAAPTYTVTLPATLEVAVGGTETLTATVKDGSGNEVPASVSWNTTSLTAANATFAPGSGATGTVTGVAAGSAGTITASINIGGVTATSNACAVTVKTPYFLVSATKKVIFAKGNVQYKASTQSWRFAEHQWDFVGDAESGTVYEGGVKSSNNLIAQDYDGWIDCFGWGTGANPWLASSNNTDYTTFVEWGRHFNDAGIGLDSRTDGTWSTLSSSEWVYLFQGRPNASFKRGLCTIYDSDRGISVRGILFMPDNFDAPVGTSSSSTTSNYNITYFAGSGEYPGSPYSGRWEDLEAVGAVFLPEGPFRFEDRGMTSVNVGCHYWSSTEAPPATSTGHLAGYVFTTGGGNGVNPESQARRYYGLNVRLVREVQ